MYSEYYKRDLEVLDIFDIMYRARNKKISGILDLALWQKAFPKEYALLIG